MNSRIALSKQIVTNFVIGILALTIGFALALSTTFLGVTEQGNPRAALGTSPQPVVKIWGLSDGRKTPALSLGSGTSANPGYPLSLTSWIARGASKSPQLASSPATLLNSNGHIQITPWFVNSGKKLPVNRIN